MVVRRVTLGSREYFVVDLNQPLSQDTEVYPGDPKPSLNQVFCNIKDTGFQYHIQQIGDHNFRPHADAPSHQNPELQHRGMEYWGLDRVFNKSFMIDLSNSAEAQETSGVKWLTEVRKKHLEPYSNEFSERGAVVIRTGYDKWLEMNKPHTISRIPYLLEDAADFVSSFKNIKVFATDSLTVDANGKHYTHRKFKDIMLVESLVSLYEIPQEVRGNFDLQTSPIRIVGATGCPVSAYAFYEK